MWGVLNVENDWIVGSLDCESWVGSVRENGCENGRNGTWAETLAKAEPLVEYSADFFLTRPLGSKESATFLIPT